MNDVTKLNRVGMLAKRFNIPPQTLHRWVHDGVIPSVTTQCGLPLVTEAAVKQYLRNGRRGPGRPRKEGR